MKISRRRPNEQTIPSMQVGVSRKGIGMVEIIVAMIVLGIAVTSLAGLSYSVSQSTIKVTGAAYRNGVIMQEVNRMIALPYDSIPAGTTYASVYTGPYPHTRSITVTEPVVNFKRVKVIVNPTNPIFKPDTINFTRSKARTSKVLCTVSCA